EAILQKAKPGDVVAFCPDQLGPAVTRVIDRHPGPKPHLVAYPTGGSTERVNWVDYAQRNAKGTPAPFAINLDREAGPSGNAHLVQSPRGYRTFGSSCNTIIAELDNRRGDHQVLLLWSTKAYEKMQLD